VPTVAKSVWITRFREKRDMAPGTVLGWLLCGWVAAVATLISYLILTGRIALRGLFTIDGDRFSLERLQLFIVFLTTLVVYAGDAIHEQKLPEVSDLMLFFLGGSNILYLTGKVARPPATTLQKTGGE
jgi:hypothetical protein